MRAILWSVRRLLVAGVTVVGVSVLIFVAVRLMPGSYASIVLGPLASDAQRAAATERFGLDQSIVVQYAKWIGNAAGGDFGTSFVTKAPVSEEFALRLPITGTIAVAAIVITLLIGIPLGLMTALRAGKPSRRRQGRPERRSGGAGGRLISALGISLPDFVLGSVVVFIVSSVSIGLRVGQFVPFSEDAGGYVRSLILPVLVLSVGCIAVTARNTRDAVLNVLVEPHIDAAVARGESPWHIVRHHLARNAAAPVLTLVSTIFATLLGGTVIVETIFDVPGLGSYVVTALGRRDYAIIQAAVLLAAVVFILTSLLVDVLSNLIDPRLRTVGAAS